MRSARSTSARATPTTRPRGSGTTGSSIRSTLDGCSRSGSPPRSTRRSPRRRSESFACRGGADADGSADGGRDATAARGAARLPRRLRPRGGRGPARTEDADREARAAERVILRFVLWNLADSKTNIGELRRYLRDESVDAHARVPGLRFKAWISDEATERWGAVYLWESAEAAQQVVPSRARELIGKDPEIGETFDVEATVEGRYVFEELSRLGLAFDE